MKSVFRISVCLLCCVGLILGCFPVKAEASALAATVGIGVAACLILMSAGVVFNPRSLDEVQAIGQSFQSYLQQWGIQNSKQDAVESYIDSIVIINPLGGNPIAPKDKVLKIAENVRDAIFGWVYAVMINQIQIKNENVPAAFGFTATRLSSYSSTSTTNIFPQSYEYLLSDFTDEFWSCLPKLGVADYVMVTAIRNSSPYLVYGLYFDESGAFCMGEFINSLLTPHASLLGVFSLKDLELVESRYIGGFGSSSTFSKIFYDKSSAEADPSFLTSNYLAFNFNGAKPAVYMYDTLLRNSAWFYPFYEKLSTDSTWAGTARYGFNHSRGVSGYWANTDYVTWSEAYPTIKPAALVGDVLEDLENGVQDAFVVSDIGYSQILLDYLSPLTSLQQISQQMVSGDLTLEEYQAMTYVGSSLAATPAFVTNIPYGSSITYSQGAAAAPITVLATSSDGGTLSYEWYRYGTGEDGKVYPVEVLGTSNSFTPSTAEVGTSYYYCKVTNVNSDGLYATNISSSIAVEVTAAPGIDSEPGTETDEDKIAGAITGAITDAIPGIKESITDAIAGSNTDEENKATSTGTDTVGQVIDLIPDYSSLVMPGLRQLASSLSYEGTSCILTMPAITLPGIDGLFKEAKLLDEQTVDFEDYFQMIPDVIMTIIRAVLDIAVVFFCIREVKNMIGQALMGFPGKEK